MTQGQELFLDFYNGKCTEEIRKLTDWAGSDAGSMWFAHPYPRVPSTVIDIAVPLLQEITFEKLRKYRQGRIA